MLLIEDGLVELDAPAAKYIPEFGNTGKEVITIRQLLKLIPTIAYYGERTVSA